MVCSMFGVETIYTNQKEKLVKEECSREYVHGLWEFQIIPNLIETRTVIYYFFIDCAILGSSCFATEA